MCLGCFTFDCHAGSALQADVFMRMKLTGLFGHRLEARFSYFGGKNTYLRGKNFCFHYMFKTIFLGTTKFGVQAPGGYRPGWRYKKVENHWSIGLISSVRTNKNNVRAERSANESKYEVKQIYLRQYNVALSLIAPTVCWKYAEQDRAAQWAEITAASFQLENIFEDFKLLTMRRFVARGWFTFF